MSVEDSIEHRMNEIANKHKNSLNAAQMWKEQIHYQTYTND